MALPENNTNALDPQTNAQLEKLRLEVLDLKWKVRWVYRLAQLTSVFLALVAIAGFLWNLYQFNAQQQMNAEREAKAHLREFRKPVWDRQLALYYELAELTATIAALPKDDEDRKKALSRFFILYTGPSVFVEGKAEDPEHRPSLFSTLDIVDPVALAEKLKSAKDPLSQYLKTQLSSQLQEELGSLESTKKFLREPLHKGLTDDLNRILRDPSLSDHFEQVKLSEDTRSLKDKRPEGEELIRLNRLLLEEGYPSEIGLNLRTELLAFMQCLEGSEECEDEISRPISLRRLAQEFAYKCRAKIGSTWDIKFSDESTETTTQVLP